MVNINKKIMGMPINIAVDDGEELKANAVINFANDIYGEVQKEYSNILDSGRLRAIAIYKLVSELQTIKGEKTDILDTNTKKVNDLIKIIDSVDLQN